MDEMRNSSMRNTPQERAKRAQNASSDHSAARDAHACRGQVQQHAARPNISAREGRSFNVGSSARDTRSSNVGASAHRPAQTSRNVDATHSLHSVDATRSARNATTARGSRSASTVRSSNATTHKPRKIVFGVIATFIVMIAVAFSLQAWKSFTSDVPAGSQLDPSNSQSIGQVNEPQQNEPPTSQTTGPKQTAAGNFAVAHHRSEDERRATSTSNNSVTPGPKTVYLTFDDGPSSNTHRILEVLNSYGIHATWFVKGNSESIEYVKDIWENGNQLAIHTQTHNYEQIYASTDAFWKDLHAAEASIKAQVGFAPTLTRFPGGSYNSYNGAIAQTLFSQLASNGYHYFDWNISSGDGGEHDADFIVDYVLGQADGCHSCCVLMHDSAAKDTTVEALPRIIEWFIDNGFEFDVLLADSYGYRF